MATEKLDEDLQRLHFSEVKNSAIVMYSVVYSIIYEILSRPFSRWRSRMAPMAGLEI